MVQSEHRPKRPRITKLIVPDVVGLNWEDAVIHLRNEGFVSKPTIRYTEAYEAEDTVVSQEPMRGQIVFYQDPITLHVAKRSLLRFLPSVFQSTGSGADPDFLRNFLWIFHEIHDSVSRRIDRVHEQFSPFTADEEFLPWLAQWVALTVDPDWPAVRKRQVIRTAAELFRARGTLPAIRRLLEIFTGVEPEIAENSWPHAGFWIGVHSAIGIDSLVAPPVNLAHCFVVRFPLTVEEIAERHDERPEQTIARIHQILRSEKPAHTVYHLEFAEAREGEEVVFADEGAVVMAVGAVPPELIAEADESDDELAVAETPDVSGAEVDIDPVTGKPKAAKPTKRRPGRRGAEAALGEPDARVPSDDAELETVDDVPPAAADETLFVPVGIGVDAALAREREEVTASAGDQSIEEDALMPSMVEPEEPKPKASEGKKPAKKRSTKAKKKPKKDKS